MNNISHTKDLYDKFAKEYHNKRLVVKDSLWNRFIEVPAMTKLVKPVAKNKKVLDLGCGSGIFTKTLKSWNANVKGCDLSKNLIEIAKKENPELSFTVCNAEKTPFKKDEFDVVVSGLMLHYLKDLKPVFKEVSRIIKTNGIFIFSMNHPTTECSERRLIDNEKISILKPYFNNDSFEWTMLDGMKLTNYHHTFENIINTLNDCGFVIERLIEMQPTKEFKKYDAKAYERTSKYPSFIAIKARKVK
jgi:ubiquinone/menaquinone biosynthesis C-methylase UbiE